MGLKAVLKVVLNNFHNTLLFVKNSLMQLLQKKKIIINQFKALLLVQKLKSLYSHFGHLNINFKNVLHMYMVLLHHFK